MRAAHVHRTLPSKILGTLAEDDMEQVEEEDSGTV